MGGPKEDKVLTGWEEGNLRFPGGGCNPRCPGAEDRGAKSASSKGHSLGRGMPERMFKAGAGEAHKLPSYPLYAFPHVTSSGCLPR